MDLNPMQKLACEGVWRAYRKSGGNLHSLPLQKNTPEPQARRMIADYVRALPIYHLPALIMPDMQKNGAIKNGYSRQWSQVSEAGLRHDLHMAQQKHQRENMRASEVDSLREISDSSGTASKDPSASEPSDNGQQTDNDQTPTVASDSKTGRTDGYIAQP